MEFGIVQSRLNPIRGAGGDVFGISCDSPFALAKWAELRGFTFPLLSDFGKDVSRAYGALYDSLLGLSGVPKRAAFLVDARGTLRHQEISEDAGVMPDLNGFIDRLKTLG